MVFFFKGSNYWKYEENGISSKYPKRIHDHWRGLPDEMDAIFEAPNGLIYAFKDSMYWRFDDKTLQVSFQSSRFMRYRLNVTH